MLLFLLGLLDGFQGRPNEGVSIEGPAHNFEELDLGNKRGEGRPGLLLFTRLFGVRVLPGGGQVESEPGLAATSRPDSKPTCLLTFWRLTVCRIPLTTDGARKPQLCQSIIWLLPKNRRAETLLVRAARMSS